MAMAMTSLATTARAQQCGSQAGWALCPDCLCCSKWGYCGSTSDYCSDGCQSQCSGCDIGGVAYIITRSVFEDLLPYRNNALCSAWGFYTYDAFIAAARAFPGFGTTGDAETRKRELEQLDQRADYCQPSNRWPCAAGKQYCGRGPMQLTWNYNYGQAREAMGLDLLNHPELVANDTIVSFETAMWFWMTPQSPKPSCHDVMTGQWRPSPADVAAGRLPGYGVTTNIINGNQCGPGSSHYLDDNAVGFYKHFCDKLGMSYGENLDCRNQRPFDQDNKASSAFTSTDAALDHADA
ncbi:chitinase [Panicum miliaceum]|uniref:chitinase n=1 Tax=Panicum miliaceum TaxID=4540 RepID=A0A3L6PE21_PANMI|nr:chitinase [Panicum miliaceum]